MRKIAFIILLLVATSACAADGVPSNPDPFNLKYPAPGTIDACCGNSVGSKTRVSATINTGIKNLIIIAAGQSNINDNMGAAYTPSNPTKIDNFYLIDGAIYAASDPLLGSAKDDATLGPGNYLLRLADNLITSALFDRIIIFPIAVGGTSVSDWDTGQEGGRFLVAFNRLNARSITPGVTGVTIAILWGQGETDTANGTSQATYTTSMNNVIAQARAAGFGAANVPIFVAEESWNAGSTSANVENAQAAVVSHPSNIWAGPNLDSINNSGRSDTTHFNPTGAATAATLWATALHACATGGGAGCSNF